MIFGGFLLALVLDPFMPFMFVPSLPAQNTKLFPPTLPQRTPQVYDS